MSEELVNELVLDQEVYDDPAEYGMSILDESPVVSHMYLSEFLTAAREFKNLQESIAELLRTKQLRVNGCVLFYELKEQENCPKLTLFPGDRVQIASDQEVIFSGSMHQFTGDADLGFKPEQPPNEGGEYEEFADFGDLGSQGRSDKLYALSDTGQGAA